MGQEPTSPKRLVPLTSIGKVLAILLDEGQLTTYKTPFGSYYFYCITFAVSSAPGHF